MKPSPIRAVRGFALFPYATTKSWGHMMLFRDSQLAADFALVDPFYREVVEVEIRPLKRKGKKWTFQKPLSNT